MFKRGNRQDRSLVSANGKCPLSKVSISGGLTVSPTPNLTGRSTHIDVIVLSFVFCKDRPELK